MLFVRRWYVIASFLLLLAVPSEAQRGQAPPPAPVPPPPKDPALTTPLPELPPLVDLAQLHLEVTGAEVLPQIASTLQGKPGALRANPGYKLVAVSLRGLVATPCRITLTTADFSATYLQKTTQQVYGNPVARVDVEVNESIALSAGNNWMIASPGRRATVTYFVKEAGALIFKVVVPVPTPVREFVMRYGALAKGKATVGAPPPPEKPVK